MSRCIQLLLSVTFAICGLTSTVVAQTATEPQIISPPVIWLDPALGELQPIRLQSIDVQIQMQGFLASTTMDLVFSNPNDRVLEGELVFPLSAEQSVTGYALEVEGRMRQAVVVEKQQARVAFEETVRRGIDPGLAELTQGNVFRTRLYPIPARGSKRVAITFEQSLIDAGTEFRYVLPLAFKEVVERFRVRAESVQAQASAGQDDADSFTISEWRPVLVGELDRRDVRPDRELRFAIPKSADLPWLVEAADVLEPEWRTFATLVPVESIKLKRAAPRRIALFYDASASAAQRNRARELDVLEAWFKKLGSVEVRLIVFRNDADGTKTFKIENGDARALRQAIESLPLDGGTALGAIDFNAAADADVVLVLSDGLQNFASAIPKPSTASRAAPLVHVLHAAQSTDSRRLAQLAHAQGGQLIDLLKVDTDEALSMLASETARFGGVRVIAGECTALTPAQPASGRILVTGRCRGKATLAMSADTALSAPMRIGVGATIPAAQAGWVRRLWARQQIDELLTSPRPDTQAIETLAKTHSIVTAYTSLLVLDRIEDYVRYRIEPAEADLKIAYQQALAALPKSQAADNEPARIESLVAQWEAFKQYHATRHPWLETVLLPAAETELQRWQHVQQDKSAKLPVDDKALARARTLRDEARALQASWSKAGAVAASRADWERRASENMLALDALRQQRLKHWPQSDVDFEEVSSVTSDQQRSMARPSPAPPAPSEPMPADAASAELSLDAIQVTGSRISRADMELAANDGASDAKPAAEPSERVMNSKIELAAWDPATPYLIELRAAADPYASYLQQRQTLAQSPAFFLDCADFFRNEKKDPRLALRILSNLAEIDVESAPLLRILAYRLQQWQRYDLAVPLFEQVLDLRAEEPQSLRDLALSLARQPEADPARAVQLLWDIARGEWDGRFPEVQVIALHELNDILASVADSVPAAKRPDAKIIGIDPRLLNAIPVALRVVLSWDADNTDIDIWVIDPIGEVAKYSHPRTSTGGHVSRDFVRGYGPEVFTIRRPLPGTYVVKTHYFADHQQKLSGGVTLQLEFQTSFGSKDSQRQAVTRRLESSNEDIEIGRFTVQ